MVKRWAFLIVLLLVPSLAFAQGTPPDVSALAGYFPADTLIFAAIRTDEGFLDDVLSMSQSAIDAANSAGASAVTSLTNGGEAPVTSIEDEINNALATLGTDFDAVQAWLGDSAALGITSAAMTAMSGGMTEGVYFVIEIADRDGAEAFLKSALPAGSGESTEGDYTVFSVEAQPNQQVGTTLALSDDLLLVYPSSMANPLLTREARLDSSGSFQQVVGALANAPYVALLYVDPRPAGSSFPLDPSGEVTLTTAPVALGWTYDDSSTIVDVAQLPADGAAIPTLQALSSDFAQSLPGNASGVIHATDLTGLYESLMGLADTMNASGGGGAPVPSEQIAQGMMMLGIDLDKDLLSWTTGDYALFYRTDLVQILQGAVTGSTPDLSGLGDKFDFGLVIEATDADKAKALAQKLGALLGMMSANAEGLEISTETIGGTDVTVFSLSAPIDPTTTLDVDLLLGASDDAFFLATRPAAERILTGDGTLANDPAYIEAQDYVLPNPTFLFYGDGEGVVDALAVGTIIPLALLGPAIGNVFDNVVAGLDAGSTTMTPTSTPAPSGLQMFGSDVDPEMIVEQLEAALNSIHSATVSATVTEDGIYLTRIVVIVAE